MSCSQIARLGRRKKHGACDHTCKIQAETVAHLSAARIGLILLATLVSVVQSASHPTSHDILEASLRHLQHQQQQRWPPFRPPPQDTFTQRQQWWPQPMLFPVMNDAAAMMQMLSSIARQQPLVNNYPLRSNNNPTAAAQFASSTAALSRQQLIARRRQDRSIDTAATTAPAEQQELLHLAGNEKQQSNKANGNGKLLVCYYANRHNAPPIAGAREFVVPTAAANKLQKVNNIDESAPSVAQASANNGANKDKLLSRPHQLSDATASSNNGFIVGGPTASFGAATMQQVTANNEPRMTKIDPTSPNRFGGVSGAQLIDQSAADKLGSARNNASLVAGGIPHTNRSPASSGWTTQSQSQAQAQTSQLIMPASDNGNGNNAFKSHFASGANGANSDNSNNNRQQQQLNSQQSVLASMGRASATTIDAAAATSLAPIKQLHPKQTGDTNNELLLLPTSKSHLYIPNASSANYLPMRASYKNGNNYFPLDAGQKHQFQNNNNNHLPAASSGMIVYRAPPQTVISPDMTGASMMLNSNSQLVNEPMGPTHRLTDSRPQKPPVVFMTQMQQQQLASHSAAFRNETTSTHLRAAPASRRSHQQQSSHHFSGKLSKFDANSDHLIVSNAPPRLSLPKMIAAQSNSVRHYAMLPATTTTTKAHLNVPNVDARGFNGVAMDSTYLITTGSGAPGISGAPVAATNTVTFATSPPAASSASQQPSSPSTPTTTTPVLIQSGNFSTLPQSSSVLTAGSSTETHNNNNNLVGPPNVSQSRNHNHHHNHQEKSAKLVAAAAASTTASPQSSQPIAAPVQSNSLPTRSNGSASPSTPSSSSSSSSPFSTMLDVLGVASQYLMRFKPSSLISPASFVAPASSFNNIHQQHVMSSSQASTSPLVNSLASADHFHSGAADVGHNPLYPPHHYHHFQLLNQNNNNNNNSAATETGPAANSLPRPVASLAATGSIASLSDSSAASSQAAPNSLNTDRKQHNHNAASSSGSTSSSSVAGSFLSRLSLQTKQRREDVCGRTIQIPERRIIGGEGARYGEFPYQVHIKISKHQCGGALVDRRSIVTAAHCVYHFITRAPVSKLQIVIGAYDIEDDQYQELPPQYFKVNKVKLHPNFRFSASHPDRYDIAILKLDKPVKYTDNVLPVCLPSKDLKFENMIGTVTGFGKTDPSLSNRYGTRLLQKVDVPIIENSECERWHRTRGIDLRIFPEMMCAGYEDGLKDACVGDSGGPLVVKTPVGPNGSFRWTLAGITSAGFGCAQSRQPGIYHRVSHTVDWILENLD